MKEKGNKRIFRSFMAALMAFVLAFVPVLSSLPAIQAEAADAKVWYHVETGSGNGNAHTYSQSSTSPAAVLLHKTERIPEAGGAFSVTYEKQGTPSDARLGFFYLYVDDSNFLYIGSNPNGAWYYEYKVNGTGSYPSLSELPSVTDGTRTTISVSLSRETLVVNVNGTEQKVTNQDLITLAETAGSDGKFGFRAGKYGDQHTSFHFTDAKLNNTDLGGDWEFLVDCEGQVFQAEEPVPVYTVSGMVLDAADDSPIAGATVRVGTESVRTDESGAYSVSVEAGTYQVSVSASGYVAGIVPDVEVSADKSMDAVKLTKKTAVVYENYISAGTIQAAVSGTFPQVYQYKLTLGETEKVIAGQSTELSTVEINGTAIIPTMGTVEIGTDSAVYPMTLKNEEAGIDMEMTVKISVADNDLTWEVTNITKKEGCAKIKTIAVPNLNLVTITEDQADAEFMGAIISGNTNSSGDQKITFDSGFRANESSGYAYGFLSADGVSAGVWSNSEAAADKRLLRNNGVDSISLTSAPWYYEYGDAASELSSPADYDDTPVSELPSAKVCLAGDENEDGTVDWQDGAIAYRDIMNNPLGWENVKELVNYRISMNFSSQATNPYLKTADNIKKVYLATDGLPQAVMMKGYGSEGHDSANSEYGKIAERLGGVEELKKLNSIAHQYNTEMGIHVNAQEAYPEAQSFTDDLILSSGTLGWGWLDQSYKIDRSYDLGTGLRYKRFLQLYDQLNGTSLYKNAWPGIAGQGTNEEVADADTIASTVAEMKEKVDTNLDFIYLDVWYGDSWETRKIAQQINSLGWRFSTEFGYEGEYDSTWQHWATEGHYGGSTMKGLNSDVIRFIRNHQKDSFVLNYPSYGGTADNPLLGGFALTGFEGWGGSNDSFNTYMTGTFAENLPTKFLQHYLVYKWENYEEGESPVGNHEKEITLKNGDDTVVVTRKEEQRSDNYIERTITLNGKKVLDDVTYLLPWTDSETNEEKLYHYNYEGGTTTWELQDDWKTLANVVVYKLTDVGRTGKQEIAVENGSVTLTADADTPYVVLKGDETPKTVSEWSVGAHVKDTGFNSYAGTGDGSALNEEVWSGDTDSADVKVTRVDTGNKYLAMGSESEDLEVSTPITGLEAGKDYVAEIYVDNKSDAKAWIEVVNGTETVSNYTLKSLAGNYVQADAHNNRGMAGSRMQIMQVSFTAASTEASLVLKREAGKEITYFDDIRIVQQTLNNIQEDGSFKQDFESVVQGIYPFVLGSAQGVTDHVTHLSEKNAPYTQSGWGNVILDDVIGGTWSLKHHGNNNGIIYRTIPQNLHLDSGVTYDISFDYQAGRDNMYYIVIGDGEEVTDVLEYLPGTAASAVGEKSTTETFSFQVTGSETGQSWFGLASTSFTEQEGVAYCYGQKDFILDNLEVRESNMTLGVASLKMQGIGDVQKLTAAFKDGQERTITWTSSDESVVTVDDNGYVDAVGIGSAVITATAMDGENEMSVTCNVTVVEESVTSQSGQFAAVSGNTEETSGEPAPATNAADGDVSTFWHSNWAGEGFTVSENNPAILTLTLNDGAEAFNGLQIVQRPSGSNGLVQKLKYVIGNSYDEETGTVGDVVKEATVTVSNTAAGATENISWDEPVTAKYIQIQVLQGSNGFAAIAEVKTCNVEVYTSLEEEQNAVNEAEETLTAAQEELKAAQGELDAAKEALENAETDLERAQAEADIAQAELDVQNAKVAEAEAQKDLAEAQKALADAKAEKNADSADIAEREAAKATAAQTTATAAAANVTTLSKALEELQATLDQKTAALNQAKLTAATAKLNDTLAAAEAVYTAGQKNYTDESWKTFEDAYKAALDGKTSTELATVEALEKALADAQAGLTDKSQAELDLIAAKGEVAAAVKAADAIYAAGGSAYTAESWKAFTDAYTAAKNAAANADAATLKALAAALTKAQSGLVKATTTTPTPNPGTPAPAEELKKGDTVTVKNVLYKVTNASKKTVTAVRGTNKKATSAAIAATVKVKGVTCKVTAVSAKAFKGYAKLKKVTIGKNVTTVGKQAFYGCKKLTKVSFKGTAVKSIKSGAFKKTNAKIKVTLPKKLKGKKRTKVVQMLKKAGVKSAK